MAKERINYTKINIPISITGSIELGHFIPITPSYTLNNDYLISYPFYFFDISPYIIFPLLSGLKIFVFPFDVIHSFGFYFEYACPRRMNSLIIQKLNKIIINTCI